MADLWLGDFGLRVTDFEESIEFYTKLFDFEVLVRKESNDSKYEAGICLALGAHKRLASEASAARLELYNSEAIYLFEECFNFHTDPDLIWRSAHDLSDHPNSLFEINYG